MTMLAVTGWSHVAVLPAAGYGWVKGVNDAQVAPLFSLPFARVIERLAKTRAGVTSRGMTTAAKSLLHLTLLDKSWCLRIATLNGPCIQVRPAGIAAWDESVNGERANANKSSYLLVTRKNGTFLPVRRYLNREHIGTSIRQCVSRPTLKKH